MQNKIVKCGKLSISNTSQFTLIAGPCQLENERHAINVAEKLKEITEEHKIGLIYKTSFDKANRTSIKGKRGVGLENSLPVFDKIRKNLNIPVKIVSNPSDLKNSEKFILPGVGAFDYAMDKLNNSGMRDILDNLIKNEKKYILGICVGMQMLTKSSDEGVRSGLSWLDAKVKKFNQDKNDYELCIPHMGWNNVQPQQHRLFKDLQDPRFYFLHSYYFSSDSSEEVLAVTNYGARFSSAVHNQHIYGVQFHPEKSHHWGVQLLKNFAEL